MGTRSRSPSRPATAADSIAVTESSERGEGVEKSRSDRVRTDRTRPVRGRGTSRLAVGATVLAGVGAVAAAAAVATGVVGPESGVTANGRLHAQDATVKLVQVGNFPTGGALTPDGRYYWSV